MTEPEQLRDLLSIFRDGRDGKGTGRSFADAWQSAVEHVCKYSTKPEYWRKEFERERAAWERSYNRQEPTDAERALFLLVQSWHTLSVDTCEWCDGPLRLGHSSRARYCSQKCKRRAANRREQVTRQGWPSARGRSRVRTNH